MLTGREATQGSTTSIWLADPCLSDVPNFELNHLDCPCSRYPPPQPPPHLDLPEPNLRPQLGLPRACFHNQLQPRKGTQLLFRPSWSVVLGLGSSSQDRGPRFPSGKAKWSTAAGHGLMGDSHPWVPPSHHPCQGNLSGNLPTRSCLIFKATKRGNMKTPCCPTDQGQVLGRNPQVSGIVTEDDCHWLIFCTL